VQLEAEKSTLQKELQEVKRQSQLMASRSVEQMQVEEDASTTTEPRRPNSAPVASWLVGRVRAESSSPAHEKALLYDDGEPGDGDVSFWTPAGRAKSMGPRSYASGTCVNCILQ